MALQHTIHMHLKEKKIYYGGIETAGVIHQHHGNHRAVDYSKDNPRFHHREKLFSSASSTRH